MLGRRRLHGDEDDCRNQLRNISTISTQSCLETWDFVPNTPVVYN